MNGYVAMRIPCLQVKVEKLTKFFMQLMDFAVVVLGRSKSFERIR